MHEPPRLKIASLRCSLAHAGVIDLARDLQLEKMRKAVIESRPYRGRIMPAWHFFESSDATVKQPWAYWPIVEYVNT